MLPDDNEVEHIRQRIVELRPTLPADWLARLGSYRSVGGEPAPPPSRIELAATLLGRQAKFTEGERYEREICEAVICGQTGSVAYVESRSRWRGDFQDINFHLRIRSHEGEQVEWEVESYNPYFGCDVGFLEWYGDRVLFIYREKHHTYICRFGLQTPADYQTIDDYWVLDGPHIGYWGYQDKEVRRLAIPEITKLPRLSERQASKWKLLPEKLW